MRHSGYCATVLALLAFGSTAAWADDDDADTMLKTDVLVGVSGPYLGNANPIRGVRGGGLPWVLSSGKAKLGIDGELKVEVRGLIIPITAGPGLNPAPFFRATVSCLGIDAGGNPTTVNVSTTNGAEVMVGDPTLGNAKIKAHLALPSPCIAPIVLVTSATGAWFAATGF
jgi:hypothetical protein